MNFRLVITSLLAVTLVACTESTAPDMQLPADQSPVVSNDRPHFLTWDRSNGPKTFTSLGVNAQFTTALSTAPATMAVDHSSSATASTDQLTWSHTVGGGSNRLLMVGVSIRNGGKTVTGVNYGNASLSFLGARNNHDSAVRVELWYLVAPPMGTAEVEVSLSGGAKVVGGATSVIGVDPNAPFGGLMSNGSTGTGTENATIALSSAGELAFAALATEGSAKHLTAASTQSAEWELFYGNSGGDVAGAASTSAASVMTWTKEKAKWAVVAVTLTPATVAGPAVDQYQVGFWAVRGQPHTVQINYDDGGVTTPFMQLDVTDPIQRPDGSTIAVGDSVFITVAVDPLELKVHFEPSGLQFGSPSPLQMWYTGADDDFNGDGVVDAADAYIQANLLGVWYQQSDHPWTSMPSEHDSVTEWVRAYLEHFSGYAVSW